MKLDEMFWPAELAYISEDEKIAFLLNLRIKLGPNIMTSAEVNTGLMNCSTPVFMSLSSLESIFLKNNLHCVDEICKFSYKEATAAMNLSLLEQGVGALAGLVLTCAIPNIVQTYNAMQKALKELKGKYKPWSP